MVTSIKISALILVLAAIAGWLIDGRLADTRAEEGVLAAEAARLGVGIGDTQAARRVRPSHAAHEQEAKQLAVAYLALPKARKRIGNGSVEYGTDVDRQIAALDTSQFKIFLADVLVSMELDGTIVPERVNYLLSNLARNDPKGALELFMKHSAVCRKDFGCDVVSTALGAWAKYDPFAAVEWIKKNAGEFPEALSGQSINNVFYEAAQKDPRLAFTLLASMGLNDDHTFSSLCAIVNAAATDEQRNATLAALRDYCEAHKDDKKARQVADQMVGYFSRGFRENGFQAGSKWLASANLSPDELDRFCGELTLNYRGDEHAEWIEWIGGNIPPGRSDGPIMDLIRRWTTEDYEAAGKWLRAAPDGPTKNAAIRSYALTVFKHDPETAMQWIMTLPPGRDSDNTLKNIHMNWPKDDPEGAAAFARENGIEK
jgi:hypothetical protein